MEKVEHQIARSVRHHYRNTRGAIIGLRCAFADAAAGKVRPDMRLGVDAAHGFAEMRIRLDELRAVKDQSFQTAWNRAQRHLFRPHTPPPGLADLFAAYAEVLKDTRSRYALNAADIDARAKKNQFGLYRSYGRLLSQSGALRTHIRAIDAVTGVMDGLLDKAKGLGEAGEVAFLRSFTPDMRRAGLIPGR